MSACQTCKHWQRHYPNDGGVCWNPAPKAVDGLYSTTNDRIGIAAIGDTMAQMWSGSGMLVTCFDSTCEDHSP